MSQLRSRRYDFDEPESVNRFLETFLPPSLLNGSDAAKGGYLPDMRLDLKETDNAIHVSVDLPGVNKDDVQVSFSPDRVLTVSAERKSQQEETDSATKSVYRERTFGHVHRTLKLPRTVNPEDSSCHFDNGVLDIRIGKRDPESDRKYLPIN